MIFIENLWIAARAVLLAAHNICPEIALLYEDIAQRVVDGAEREGEIRIVWYGSPAACDDDGTDVVEAQIERRVDDVASAPHSDGNIFCHRCS